MRAIIRGCLFMFITLSLFPVAWADSVEHSLFNQAEIATWEELDNARGRQGIDVDVLNNMNISALLSGNTANNNTTGVNIIDNGSFSGAMGMFSVIQNSGNNVLIQDSTIVNVTIVP